VFALAWTILLSGVGVAVVTAFYLTFEVWQYTSLAIMVIAIVVGAYFNQPRSRKMRRPLWGGRRPIEEGVTKNHGDQRWATVREQKAAFPGPKGLVVGEASFIDPEEIRKFSSYDKSTWGGGGRGELLIDPLTELSTHSIVCGASGSHKSMSAVTSIYNWPWQAFAFDPKIELGPMMREPLEDLGRKVYEVGLGTPGVNAIGWINTNDPEAEDHVKMVVETIYDDSAGAVSAAQFPSKEVSFWIKWGKALTTCLLAHLLWSDDGRQKTLAELRKGIRTPERRMVGLLKTIHEKSNSQMARDTASGLMEMRAEETFSGVYANAFSGTEWLQVEAYANLVSDLNGFDPRELLSDGTILFVQIPLRTLRSTPALAKVLLGCLLNTIYLADPSEIDGRVFGYIDEAKRFGAMPQIAEGYDTGRSFKLTMQLVYQADSQIEEVWGRDGAKTIRENCSWIAYSPVQEKSLSESLSQSIGQRGAMAYSQGDNTGRQTNRGSWFRSMSIGSNLSQHEIAVPVIRPEAIRRLPSDVWIILTKHCPWPIICHKAIYYRRRELAKVIKSSRFAQQVSGRREAA